MKQLIRLHVSLLIIAMSGTCLGMGSFRIPYLKEQSKFLKGPSSPIKSLLLSRVKGSVKPGHKRTPSDLSSGNQNENQITSESMSDNDLYAIAHKMTLAKLCEDLITAMDESELMKLTVQAQQTGDKKPIMDLWVTECKKGLVPLNAHENNKAINDPKDKVVQLQTITAAPRSRPQRKSSFDSSQSHQNSNSEANQVPLPNVVPEKDVIKILKSTLRKTFPQLNDKQISALLKLEETKTHMTAVSGKTFSKIEDAEKACKLFVDNLRANEASLLSQLTRSSSNPVPNPNIAAILTAAIVQQTPAAPAVPTTIATNPVPRPTLTSVTPASATSAAPQVPVALAPTPAVKGTDPLAAPATNSAPQPTVTNQIENATTQPASAEQNTTNKSGTVPAAQNQVTTPQPTPAAQQNAINNNEAATTAQIQVVNPAVQPAVAPVVPAANQQNAANANGAVPAAQNPQANTAAGQVNVQPPAAPAQPTVNTVPAGTNAGNLATLPDPVKNTPLLTANGGKADKGISFLKIGSATALIALGSYLLYTYKQKSHIAAPAA